MIGSASYVYCIGLFSYFSYDRTGAYQCSICAFYRKRLSSIGRIWCFTYPSSTMALLEWDFVSDDDPWKVSAFFSAIVELFLSILLLLGAAIAFITSRFVRFFGLEPPCTYIGCSHPLHFESFKGRIYPATASCKSKDLCTCEFCPLCYSSRIYSKLHSNGGSNDEGSQSGGGEERDAFSSRDHDSTENDEDASSDHLTISGNCRELHPSCDHQCRCSGSTLYRKQNQNKLTTYARAASSSKLNEDDLPLLSARSSSKSSDGFDLEDHCEISADAEEERAWKETCMKDDGGVDDDASFAYSSEALGRKMLLEDVKKMVCGIPDQAGSAEPLSLYNVVDEFEEPKILMNNTRELLSRGAKLAVLENQGPSQCNKLFQSTDKGKGSNSDIGILASHLSLSSVDVQKAETILVNEKGSVVGGNSQETGSNEPASEKDMRQSRELILAKHLNWIIQRAEVEQNIYEDDRLEKGVMPAFLASLDPSSQQAIGEGIKEACLEGADAFCEKDGCHSEGEERFLGIIGPNCNQKQGGLSMKDLGRVVEGDVLDSAIASKESSYEPASMNASTKGTVQSFLFEQYGRSSKRVEEMAPSVSPLEADEDEGEIISEEEQEEGLVALKVALRAERSVLAALEAELENERNAAAIATSEAMAMISRLQEEKSAMQMEVAQLQRTSEEKADYDEQAMAVLKEILFKRETENMALEKEVELYRERLAAEKADEPKGNWFTQEVESPSPQSIKPIVLAGEAENFLSPIGAMNQQQALASLVKFYQSGTRGAPCIPQSGSKMDLEELNAFSLDQNVNKRDSPVSDKVVGMSCKLWDGEGRPRNCWDYGLHEEHDSCEDLKKMGRSVFSTDDEETQSIVERLWMLEEKLQELRGKDDLGSQKLLPKAHENQQLADNPTNRRADRSLTDVWGGQPAFGGIESKGQGEVVELDGVSERFVPIHDVYELHSAPNRSPPCVEERDPLDGFKGMLRSSELPPGSISENFIPARMARHRIQIPPRISQARKLSDEIPNTPPFTPQAAGWIVGKSSYPESPCEHHDLQSQSLVSREERRMELEEIQQLAVRLKALEEDRELLRETLESFKHRDAELNLLKEIAQHLRELRMVGFTRVSGDVFSEEASVTSPSKMRALKKRRYYSGPGQAQMLLLQQKSI